MNRFIESLDRDLDRVFFNPVEFAETVVFIRDGVETEIRGLFDAPAVETAGDDPGVWENRPRVIVRESDVGKVQSSDRFFVREKLWKVAGHESNRLGVIRVWLNEVV